MPPAVLSPPAPAPTPTVPAEPDDGTGPLFEVVDGQRVEKPMSVLSQWVGMRIAQLVQNAIDAGDVDGYVVTETFIACFPWSPGLKRRPDVAFWRRDQLPGGIPATGDLAVAPAWAVEVISPGDNAVDLNAKLGEYFRAGVELAWIVDPQTKIVHTERPDGAGHTYRPGESLDAAPVAPAFRTAVNVLFPKD